jgi:ABC-type thiamine transport system substrate-binding protein
MEITINIKDGSKAKAFLNFIKSLDFITVKVHDENINYPTMSDKEIIDRVASTNKQIKQGKTISHDDLHKESQNW